MTPISPDGADARLKKLQGRLSYSGALAKHYMGNSPLHTGQRALCEASTRDAADLDWLLTDYARLSDELAAARPDWTPGRHLLAIRMAYFNGGGWVDPLEWSDFDAEGQAEWDRLAEAIAKLDSDAIKTIARQALESSK